MIAVLNDGRFFQLKLFNRLSINSVTIYRPNESKIYVFNGNGNNSILAKGGLPYYRTGGANYRWLEKARDPEIMKVEGMGTKEAIGHILFEKGDWKSLHKMLDKMWSWRDHREIVEENKTGIKKRLQLHG